MSFESKRILAVVPARSGSKGIVGKNLIKINGVPLIGHVGMLIQKLEFIDYALLSTDSIKIADVGNEYGLMTPFIRPPALSDDKALSIDVWRHAWLEAERVNNLTFDISILLEPTSPLRISEDIIRSLKLLFTNNNETVVTVSKTPAHFTPEKTFKINPDGFLEFFISNGQSYSLRQDIPSYYHRNGICYAAKRNAIINKKTIIGKKTSALVIDRPVANIDDPADLLWAEILMSKKA